MPGSGHGVVSAPGAGGNYNRHFGIVLTEFPYIFGNNS